ncbi:MAG: MgtC/SapB family protein, partial [Acidobacteriota bacterium]|nr:MgtC/SapB family protein [Acidobacteriota bacterium]
MHVLIKLAAATLLGAVVGFQRERAGKPAGLRTHMLVAMGAALFVVLADLMIARFLHYGDVIRFDPIRSIEAIVAAIGFLGAGTIFVSRAESRVKGLTTAASIWV